MTVEAAIANYQSGRVPFVSVLEAMTSLYADRWTRESLVADHARLRASINEASLDASPEMTTVAAMTEAVRPRAAAGRTWADGRRDDDDTTRIGAARAPGPCWRCCAA